MDFQMLDLYCANLVYEIEASRHRSSDVCRADPSREVARRHKRVPGLKHLGAALLNLLPAGGRFWPASLRAERS